MRLGAYLDGNHEGVPQVQSACDVWWWDDHDKFLSVLILTGLEEAALLPPGIPVLNTSTSDVQKSAGMQGQAPCAPVSASTI